MGLIDRWMGWDGMDRLHGWMDRMGWDGYMDGWMDGMGWMYGWMDGWDAM